MGKITFIGAGSTVFAKNVLGDTMQTPAMQGFELALYDIDAERLKESENVLMNLKQSTGSQCIIQSYTDRKEALRGAKYIVNAIAVGGYDSTLIDFEIPKKYQLRQTIADTVGIGGIFRALRTIQAFEEIVKDIHEVCPDAWFLNYSNPMAILTNYLNSYADIKTVGLCHSVQVCVSHLFRDLGMDDTDVQWKIAGINHMAWLLEVNKNGQSLYPEIKRRAAEKQNEKHEDMVRYEMMQRFGYYITESSEHNAEYHPYFIKRNYPELIERFNIPLDEYPRRLRRNMKRWDERRETLLKNDNIEHKRSHEYASYIFEAMETNVPYKIGGNVMNNGLITNLPKEACVEVPCLVDRSGVQPTVIGDLPPQLAALNRTNINMQLLTLEAAKTKKKEHIYHAAMLDPHTSSELSIDDIVSMCDDLLEAHGERMKGYS